MDSVCSECKYYRREKHYCRRLRLVKKPQQIQCVLFYFCPPKADELKKLAEFADIIQTALREEGC